MESWVAGTPIAGRVPPGGDYEAVFRERVAEFSPMLSIHHADLTNLGGTAQSSSCSLTP